MPSVYQFLSCLLNVFCEYKKLNPFIVVYVFFICSDVSVTILQVERSMFYVCKLSEEILTYVWQYLQHSFDILEFILKSMS